MLQANSYITNSYEETQNLAVKLAKGLKGGEVICLYGDLGYGKTTFIQGLAKGLGIDKRILSPTFIIMRSYDDINSKNFYHVDLYRINNEQEIIDLGLIDIINRTENIVAIEWPENLGNLIPVKRIDVKFEYINENSRNIVIKY